MSNIWEPPTLESFFEEKIDQRPWLIPHFLPAQALVLLSGQQKRAFKTWFADACGAVICSGKSFDKLEPDCPPSPVLHVQMEGTPHGNKNRMRAIHDHLQTTVEDRTERYFYLFRQNVKLDDKVWIKRFEHVLSTIKPTLVILDAMVYLHSGDENKVSEMQPVIQALQMIRQSGATCLFLAHLSRAGDDWKVDMDQQVRGSGIIVNAYDTHLALRRYKATDQAIDLTIRHRDLGAEEKYSVKWVINSELEEIYSLGLTIQSGDDPVLMEDTLDHKLEFLMPGESYTRGQLRILWKTSMQKTEEIRDAALRQGRLRKSGRGYELVPKSG